MSLQPPRPVHNKLSHNVALLAVASGVLYCSWPLGYLLNPNATRGLASNLTVAGQPYSLVFVVLDITSGLLAVLVMIRLLRFMSQYRRSRILGIAVLGLGVFGLLTILDAVLPLDCVATATHACGSIFQDPYFIIHGIISVGSIFGLTVTIVALWWLLVRERPASVRLRYALSAVLILWFVFGLGTGLFITFGLPSTDSQHAFIVLNSLLLACTPYLVRRYLR